MTVVRAFDAPASIPRSFTGDLHRPHPRSSPVNFTGIPRFPVPVNTEVPTVIIPA
jgi:hypothetical protein